jgi:hypothetical protein
MPEKQPVVDNLYVAFINHIGMIWAFGAGSEKTRGKVRIRIL